MVWHGGSNTQNDIHVIFSTREMRSNTEIWAVGSLFWLGPLGGWHPTGRGCYDVIVDPSSHTYTHTSRYTRPQLCTNSSSLEDDVEIMGGKGNESCVKIWPVSEDCLLSFQHSPALYFHLILLNTLSLKHNLLISYLPLYISISSSPCYSCRFLCFLWIEEAEERSTGRTLILLRHCFLFPH